MMFRPMAFFKIIKTSENYIFKHSPYYNCSFGVLAYIYYDRFQNHSKSETIHRYYSWQFALSACSRFQNHSNFGNYTYLSFRRYYNWSTTYLSIRRFYNCRFPIL